jgi:hypothetical protein
MKFHVIGGIRLASEALQKKWEQSAPREIECNVAGEPLIGWHLKREENQSLNS